MSRQELIERMAKDEYTRLCAPYPVGRSWDQMSEGDREYFRRKVSTHLPVIVTFVADWLDGLRRDSFSDDEANIAVRRWCEEMQP